MTEKPPENSQFDGLEIDQWHVQSTDENMYEIVGLSPTGRGCGFTINLNQSFATALKSLSARDQQQAAAETLVKMHLDDQFSQVQFHDDSFLLTNITVAGQATGLDYHAEEPDSYVYHTHNVDSPQQAIEIIAVFGKWVELGRTVLTSDS